MRQGRIFFVILAALAFGIACGTQDEKTGLSKSSKKPAPPAANGPITLSELYATVERLEAGIKRVVLGQNSAVSHRTVTADRPATRGEIIAEFYRLYLAAKPKFRFTPRPVKFDPKLISISPTENVRKPLEKMIQLGFVGKVAPLATASTPNLTLPEYGDALGFFMARIGDLTHTPSTKWSPYMFGHRDDK